MKQPLLFSLKVWLTMASAAPFIYRVIQVLMDTSTEKSIGISVEIFYFIAGGIIICLPSWLIFWLSVKLINKASSPIFVKKAVLSIVLLLLMLLTFFLMNPIALLSPNYWPSELPLVISYLGMGIVGIWCYQLKREITKLPENA